MTQVLNLVIHNFLPLSVGGTCDFLIPMEYGKGEDVTPMTTFPYRYGVGGGAREGILHLTSAH